MRKAAPSFISNRSGLTSMIPVSRYYSNIHIISQDMIEVLDSSGNPSGEVLSRKEVHRLGKLHQAVHLYLFNKENKLLLQRRSELVDHYPSMLSISVTGHVDAGESSLEAVRRELHEELGLNAEYQDFKFLFSFRRDAELSSTYIDRQINDVYACRIDFAIKNVFFDSTEISEVRYVSMSDFEKMVKLNDGDIVPVYSDALEQVVPLVEELLKAPFN